MPVKNGTLEVFDFHPLQITRCLDSVKDTGVISFDKSILMEYPAIFNGKSANPAYLTILQKDSVLITIRRGVMPALDDLIQSLTSGTEPPLLHLPQLIYLIPDQFSDLYEIPACSNMLINVNFIDEKIRI